MLPKNLDNPSIGVKQANLEKYGGSEYKLVCPDCGGLILIARNMNTFILEALNRCVLCGQLYYIEDIDEMRKRDGLSGQS